MKSSPYRLTHEHKLPSKLTELFKVAESTSIVGFGATKKQQDFMLLTAFLDSKNSVFLEELTQELDEYFLTLTNDLLVNLNH